MKKYYNKDRVFSAIKEKLHSAIDEIKTYIEPRELLILLAICEKNVVNYLLIIFSKLPVLGAARDVLLHAAYVVLVFLCFKKYKIRLHVKEIVVLLFVFLAIIFTCFIYPENVKSLFATKYFWNTVFPCLRFYLVGLIFIADEKIMNMAGKASCLGIIIESLFVIVYLIPKGLLGHDEMSMAYQLLPNVLFAINYAVNSKKIPPYLISVCGITYLLAMGTRGPIAVALAYLFFKVVKSIPAKNWIKLLVIVLIAGLGLVFVKSDIFSSVLSAIGDVFRQFGFSTRILDLASSGEFISHSSGRDEIYHIALEKIKESPWFGYGVFGEWPWFNWNVHNLYLEFLVHYGVVLGPVIFLWIVFQVCLTYIKTKSSEVRDFILIWACYVFIRGFVGGSYLQFGMFFLLGFCIQELHRIKDKKRYIEKAL